MDKNATIWTGMVISKESVWVLSGGDQVYFKGKYQDKLGDLIGRTGS